MGLQAGRYSRAVEQQWRGNKAPPPKGVRKQSQIKHSHARLVLHLWWGLLASELVLLLANRPQLRGPIHPKETEVQG
jgi:hypothetical protein